MSKEIKYEGIIIKYGGKFDLTKAVSPFVFFDGKKYVMFYIGSLSQPEERRGYKILKANSKDGINFKKEKHPFLKVKNRGKEMITYKEYSPYFYTDHKYKFFYYAECSSKIYKIKYLNLMDVSHKPKSIFSEKQYFTSHSPKIIKYNNLFYLYYTSSKEYSKISSKKYPHYDFAKGFKIFLSVSSSPNKFKEGKKIKFYGCTRKYINYYGHSVFLYKEILYMCVTLFDGSVNKIGLFRSNNGINFKFVRLIVSPNQRNEIGFYSSSVLNLGNSCHRLYYGVRYFDNKWTINSLQFNL